MSKYTLDSIKELIGSDLPFREMRDKLIELFEDALKESARNKNVGCGGSAENWVNETLTNYWMWLLGDDSDKSNEQLAEQIRKKLGQLLKRCDTDSTLLKYTLSSIRNYSKKEKDNYSQFRRAFYKKTREALLEDNRFVREKREIHLFFGLKKWGSNEFEFYYNVPPDVRKEGEELWGKFGVFRVPRDGAFIASDELADASYNTLNAKEFHFCCAVSALFVLMKITGQFGELIPQPVDINRPRENGEESPGIEGVPGPEFSYEEFDDEKVCEWADECWRSLDEDGQRLLAYYILPKANGRSITRKEVLGCLGYNNDVTMKNHEEKVIRRMEEFIKRKGITGLLYRPFLLELENLIDELKSAESGHSYSVYKHGGK